MAQPGAWWTALGLAAMVSTAFPIGLVAQFAPVEARLVRPEGAEVLVFPDRGDGVIVWAVPSGTTAPMVLRFDLDALANWLRVARRMMFVSGPPPGAAPGPVQTPVLTTPDGGLMLLVRDHDGGFWITDARLVLKADPLTVPVAMTLASGTGSALFSAFERSVRNGRTSSGRGPDATPFAAFLRLDRGFSRLRGPEPVYPRDARARGIQGAAWMEVAVDSTGRVTNAQVLYADHTGFGVAAREMLERSVYTPAVLHGTPMPVRALVRVPFAPTPGR